MLEVYGGLFKLKKSIIKENEAVKEFDLEVLVSSILIGGVIISIILILIGITWHYLTTSTLTLAYNLPKQNFFNLSVATLRHAFIIGFKPDTSITLGIIVLMLTPYVRILSSVIYFAFREKNIKYTIFTTFVFSALSYSLFLR